MVSEPPPELTSKSPAPIARGEWFAALLSWMAINRAGPEGASMEKSMEPVLPAVLKGPATPETGAIPAAVTSYNASLLAAPKRLAFNSLEMGMEICMFKLRTGATGEEAFLLQPTKNNKPRTGSESRIEILAVNFIQGRDNCICGSR